MRHHRLAQPVNLAVNFQFTHGGICRMLSKRAKRPANVMTTEHGRQPGLPTPEQREARNKLAERFLDEVLLPHIQDGSLTNPHEEIPALHKAFQQENVGIGSDFGLNHTYAAAWQRDLVNECLAEKDPSRLPADAADVVVAIALLEQLGFSQK
jgi:hypothetical protein